MKKESEIQSGERTIKSASSFVAVGKDSVALLRDVALFILALLLLVFPATFNKMLSTAGFEEGSFVGFKWKGKFLQSDDALGKAQTTINDLTDQNAKLSKLLEEAGAKVSDAALKEQIQAARDESTQVTASSSHVEASIASTLADNAPLRQEVQKTSDPNTQWGVVYSGDTNMKDASYEVGSQITGMYRIPNASVYFRQGSYRGVSVLTDRAEAQQVLNRVKARRSDAYIVKMADWCPNSVQKEGFRECTAQ
jgi:hypothetical protein